VNDFVIARRGRKTLAAVGKVIRTAFYAPGKNPLLASPEYSHQNFLEVEWQQQPRDKVFPNLVFPMHTLTEISEFQYQNFLEGSGISTAISEPPDEEIDQNELVPRRSKWNWPAVECGVRALHAAKVWACEAGRWNRKMCSRSGLA
jgi:hypothetical protein